MSQALTRCLFCHKKFDFAFISPKELLQGPGSFCSQDCHNYSYFSGEIKKFNLNFFAVHYSWYAYHSIGYEPYLLRTCQAFGCDKKFLYYPNKSKDYCSQKHAPYVNHLGYFREHRNCLDCDDPFWAPYDIKDDTKCVTCIMSDSTVSSVTQKLSCDCGSEVTYGKGPFHSSWCQLVKNLNREKSK